MVARTGLRLSRLTAIQQLMSERHSLTVGELTDHLGVSEATVRRDLDALQADGLVQRTHGGAVAATPRVRERPYPERSAVNIAEKQAIAAAAAHFVSPGDTLFIGGGSTTLRLAEQLSFESYHGRHQQPLRRSRTVTIPRG